MPGNFGTDKTEDKENNGHKAKKLDGANFHVVHDGGSPHEFLQPDDKSQAGILEGDDRLGDQTGQHASEGDRYQNVAGRLAIGHAG